MKKHLSLKPVAGVAVFGVLFATVIAFTHLAKAAQFTEARVTQVVKDVKLLPAQAAPRPATLRDEVREDTGVKTGIDSRSELTFPDQTIARLGANTIFSFREGTRSVELKSGAMLLAVPKGAGGAQITTAAVTAAVTGTTVLVESRKGGVTKYIGLEGCSKLKMRKKKSEKERPDEAQVCSGQMLVVPDGATSFPPVQECNTALIVETSKLIKGFRPLPTIDLINETIENQAGGPQDGPGGPKDPGLNDVIDKKSSASPPHTPPPHRPEPTPPGDGSGPK